MPLFIKTANGYVNPIPEPTVSDKLTANDLISILESDHTKPANVSIEVLPEVVPLDLNNK